MTPKPFQQLDLYIHTLVCRRQPARAIGMKMACQPTFSNWDSLPAGREKCSAGASPEPNGPAGAPSSPSCPQIRHWYENDVTRLR